jgi:hypothetical protein
MRQIRICFDPIATKIDDVNVFTAFVEPYFAENEINANFAGYITVDAAMRKECAEPLWQYIVYDLDYATEQRIKDLKVPGYNILIYLRENLGANEYLISD